ncbi:MULTISPECIES: LysR family transcriptional regulator [Sphingomonas]|uniref:LysR family transcriptional regulator n=1 Tax=Sphingomonas zeae TaxID=1646122 RepID=A0A7Y6B200_9SPHN|nr:MULTISPECIES: LysR family transcriptional regulator [Sphingomonas]MBB4049680.1 DNA-binding transcriptional LysR family regulator [Sphingomonas zeae]MDK8187612.1 LysR family transcriptional regulator [Sphingomonas zeae]MDK8217346.1 LysR family transcriptional regulator [Sphingomonas sp. UMB7805-LC452B]NUU45828.1 LysR family transcriptional regulator [Sphingomonas zeae]
MRLDLRELLHFAVVAEEGTVTAAAARLGIAQPWLSQRMKGLEDRLGFALFRRIGRRLELTDAGVRMFDHARRLVATEKALLNEVAMIRGAVVNRLRVGAPPYSGRIAAVGDMLTMLSAHLPSLSVEMEVGWSPHLIDRVRHGDIDAAFATAPFDSTGLAMVAVDTLQRYLQFVAGDPLFGSAPIAPGDLSGRAIAVFPRGVNPQLYDQTFAPLQGIVELVATGFDGRPLKPTVGGQATIPSFFGVARQPPQPGLRPLIGPEPTTLWLVARADDERSAIRRLLVRGT